MEISGQRLDLDLSARNHPAAGPPLWLSERPMGWKGTLIGQEFTSPPTHSAGEHQAITQQVLTGTYSVPVTMLSLEMPYGTSSLVSSMKYRKAKKLPYFVRSALVGVIQGNLGALDSLGQGSL